MQKRVQYLAFLFLLLGFVTTAFSQDRQLDKLEHLYAQDAYRGLLKHANKLIDKKGYGNVAEVHLFKALALSNIGLDRRSEKKYPFAMREGIAAYEDCLVLLKTNNLKPVKKSYQKALYLAWQSEEKRLNDEGKTNQAAFYTKRLNALYDGEAPELLDPHVGDVPPETNTVSSANVRGTLFKEAHELIGTPYKYGGTNEHGFDCSGFTGFVSKKAGLTLPRTSQSQSTAGQQIKMSNAQKGDLVFFGKKQGKNYKISHVAMVVSEAGEELTVIHSTSSKGVMVTNISTSDYWQAKVLFVVNYIDQ
jgi:cell wall-associated NlpC family hydrolase